MNSDSSEKLLTALQDWYHSNCNGDWEHEFGITIQTLDNPGWAVTIQISDTVLEARSFTPVRWEKSSDDWLDCRVVDEVFTGHGGARNLVDILQIFLNWTVESKPGGTPVG